MSHTPPHFRGLPLVGSAIGFMRAPVALIQRAFAAKGPIFTLSLGPKKMACVIGPAYAAEYFHQPGDLLSVSLATEPLKPVMGDIAFPDSKEDHRRLRDAVVPLVAKHHMEQHVPAMLEEAGRAVGELASLRTFELVEVTERLSQSIAIRCFLGDAFVEHIDDRFRDAFSDLIKSVDMFLPPNLPIAKFRRRDRARSYIGRLIEDAVVERRTMVDPPADTMQWLATLRNADGEYWGMKDTVDLVVSVLFGGHHTTGALMAWAVVHLLRNKQALARVVREIDREPSLTSATLQQMTYLTAAIREAERLEPPSGFIIRVAREDLTLGGYRIRKGWLVALCPPVAQRLPEVFERPDEYDPERFLGSGPSLPAHALIGFGGGPHACVGKPFALLASRAFVATLLRGFELELVGPPPVVDAKSVLRRPAIPCRVEHRPRA